MITEQNQAQEIDRLYKDSEGGYDLQAIEAFLTGVIIAKNLHETGKGILPTEDIVKGYEWAIQQIFN